MLCSATTMPCPPPAVCHARVPSDKRLRGLRAAPASPLSNGCPSSLERPAAPLAAVAASVRQRAAAALPAPVCSSLHADISRVRGGEQGAGEGQVGCPKPAPAGRRLPLATRPLHTRDAKLQGPFRHNPPRHMLGMSCLAARHTSVGNMPSPTLATLACALLAAALLPAAGGQPPLNARSPIGTNLAAVVDWSTCGCSAGKLSQGCFRKLSWHLAQRRRCSWATPPGPHACTQAPPTLLFLLLRRSLAPWPQPTRS